MDKKIEKNWKDIDDLLSKMGPNLNILEEEIDITVQTEYFQLVSFFSKYPDKYKELCQQYRNSIEDLFDETVKSSVKKRMLVILATLDDIAVYRKIEAFSKLETPLKKWAVIALQQSRMLIQSTLLDDPGVFISTGLGGHANLLRYFCVFLNRDDDKLQEFQQNILINETESALKPLKGSIEQIDFQEGYSVFLLLLPINADLKKIFENIINECNLYGHFLNDNMIVTNVKKLSKEEISEIINRK